jgi:uncharacterized protein
MRQDLSAALKARDEIAIAALRSAIAAIDNAEAVDNGSAALRGASSAHVVGATAGVGSSDVQRRTLSDAEMREIVRGEIDERGAAADRYEQHGRHDQAARLRREAAILDEYV